MDHLVNGYGEERKPKSILKKRTKDVAKSTNEGLDILEKMDLELENQGMKLIDEPANQIAVYDGEAQPKLEKQTSSENYKQNRIADQIFASENSDMGCREIEKLIKGETNNGKKAEP